MVVGELYKRFKTHLGSSYYLVSPENNQPNDLCDCHMAALWTCHTPGKGLSSMEGGKIIGTYPMTKTHLTDEAMQMKA